MVRTTITVLEFQQNHKSIGNQIPQNVGWLDLLNWRLIFLQRESKKHRILQYKLKTKTYLNETSRKQ